VGFVAAQPVACPKSTDFSLDPLLFGFQADELCLSLGQRGQKLCNEAAQRLTYFGGPNSCLTVNLVRHGYGDIFHKFTLAQFLWKTWSPRLMVAP
jgi:hypothetical protein